MIRRLRAQATPIRLYIGGIVALSALLMIGSLLSLMASTLTAGALALFLGSILLIALATARPVELRPHVYLSLRTAPELMAAVLLGAPMAMVAAGIGVLAGYAYHVRRGRHNFMDLLFNTSQGVLSTGMAALVYRYAAGLGSEAIWEPIALLAAGEIKHIVNTFMVATAISLFGREAPIPTMFVRILRSDPLQYTALMVCGILGALLARQAFWSVPLLLVPIALVERTLLKQREEAERARKLAVMEEVNALKNDFIAAVTHDLRTPLMVVKGFGELLAERDDEFMEDERKAIESINLNAERLSELIELLLQMSELDAGMVILQRAPTDLRELVQRTVTQVGYHAEQKGVQLEVTVEGDVPTIDIDRARIEQVVANVLGNAIKFTPEGGRVAVHVGWENDQAVLTVSDTGPGIPPDVLPRIFDRFYRVQTSQGTREKTGGLGLAIAKSLAELHGGTITAASRLGEGTTFTVILPQPAGVETEAQTTDAEDHTLVQVLRPARPLPNARAS